MSKDEERRRKSKSWLKSHSRIPAKTFLGLRFQDLGDVPKKVLRAAIGYMNSFEIDTAHGLYLHSEEKGVGKTAVATCIMQKLIEVGKIRRNCVFVSYYDLIMEARKAYLKDSCYEDSALVARVLDSDLVVIDDFCEVRTTRFISELVYYLVNKLWENQKNIIVTTKVFPDDLVQRLSFTVSGEIDSTTASAIVSRLLSMCSVIEVDTPSDFRLK